ncbi:hypothetical protein MCA2693 [Methylococcus capsulatus str. Bath]|uniref:Uncharacterized protein n=1 Tax=Methylococcus capsulatus (strain ATCC 33009 / NCIMB 11132 / Bath) TaxID=243233 RepID=Q603V3_METCA|nr:hypothetical protein MCA2693 [Methylococcus capsulatus str. Bath]
MVKRLNIRVLVTLWQSGAMAPRSRPGPPDRRPELGVPSRHPIRRCAPPRRKVMGELNPHPRHPVENESTPEFLGIDAQALTPGSRAAVQRAGCRRRDKGLPLRADGSLFFGAVSLDRPSHRCLSRARRPS